MAKTKKIPLRKSVVSNEQFPKKQLLRIAFNKNGEISIDPTGKAAGRGAYIAIKKDEAKLAKKKRIFDRTFQTQIAADFYDELITYVDHLVEREKLANVTYSIDEAPEI
ncbi:RNase P modulator RnpM [Lactococcus hodotermopsidis]|nr:YlxR family RNase P modulator [Lactococcus hodotermopsidis]